MEETDVQAAIPTLRDPNVGVRFGGLESTNAVELVLRHLKAWQVLLKGNSYTITVQKEVAAQLGRVTTAFEEKVSALEGRTVLLLPSDSPSSQQARVQIAESSVLHWSRQIQDAITHDASHVADDAGLIAELTLWQTRKADLINIAVQLGSDGVQHVLETLKHSQSTYLGPFLEISSSLKSQLRTSVENAEVLQSLELPCKTVQASALKDIQGPVQGLLACLKTVVAGSSFFAAAEQMSNLLHKASNEVVKRCCNSIDTAAIFQGAVGEVVSSLQQSMETCVAYKGTATEWAVELCQSLNSSHAASFTRLDAFVQRCRDLQEVCAVEQQYGQSIVFPTFPGSGKIETAKQCQSIQAESQSLMHNLQGLPYSLLDVRARAWSADFQAFRAGARDLDRQLNMAIKQAFGTAGPLSAKLMLLPVLQAFAKRPVVTSGVDAIAESFYSEWAEEVVVVKRLFEGARHKPLVSSLLPATVAQAHQILQLKRRLEFLLMEYKVLEKRLTKSEQAAEVVLTVKAAVNSLSQFMSNLHQEWQLAIESTLSQQLELHLLSQDKEQGGLLSVSFGCQVLEAFEEVKLWSNVGLNIPHAARQLQADSERLRLLRGNVAKLAANHNEVVKMIEPVHRGLFYNRLCHLEKRLSPGFQKLTWTSGKPALEYFFKEANKAIKEVKEVAAAFVAAKQSLQMHCRAIREMQLLSIERKRVYELADFAACQAAHQQQMQAEVSQHSKEMQNTLEDLHGYFVDEGAASQRGWQLFTTQLEQELEGALKFAVKEFVTAISRALAGDRKLEVQPLFAVTLMIEKNHRIEIKPAVQEIANAMLAAAKDAQAVIKIADRLPKLPAITNNMDENKETEENREGDITDAALPSFYEVICGSEEHTKKASQHVSAAVESILDRVQELLVYWEKKYKYLWETDKDAFIRRYEKANMPVEAYESDIGRYSTVADDIRRENSAEAVKYLQLDCTPLKQILVTHCQGWASKLAGSLGSIATRELSSMLQPGHNRSIDPSWEIRLGLLQEKHAALGRIGVPVPEAEAKQLAYLAAEGDGGYNSADEQG